VSPAALLDLELEHTLAKARLSEAAQTHAVAEAAYQSAVEQYTARRAVNRPSSYDLDRLDVAARAAESNLDHYKRARAVARNALGWARGEAGFVDPAHRPVDLLRPYPGRRRIPIGPSPHVRDAEEAFATLCDAHWELDTLLASLPRLTGRGLTTRRAEIAKAEAHIAELVDAYVAAFSADNPGQVAVDLVVPPPRSGPARPAVTYAISFRGAARGAPAPTRFTVSIAPPIAIDWFR